MSKDTVDVGRPKVTDLAAYREMALTRPDAPVGKKATKLDADRMTDRLATGPSTSSVTIGAPSSTVGMRAVGGQLVTIASEGSVRVPDRLYIGGKWVKAGGGTQPVYNPATEEIIFHTPLASAADVNLAVAEAKKATKVWTALTPAQRADYLDAIGNKIKEHRQELAELEVQNNGKVLGAALGDVDLTVHCFEVFAKMAREFDPSKGESVPLPDANYVGRVMRQPRGVAAGITPWNYPLLMSAWKIAPALAAGCTLVLKPSEITPLTTLRLAELAHEVGLPAGVLNVVPGLGNDAGDALIHNADVNVISFTGSIPTGKKVAKAAAENLVPAILELGGKSPAIFFDDGDVKRNLDWVVFGFADNQGHVCSATTRLLVQEGVAAELIPALVERVKSLKVGPGMTPGMDVGAIVSKQQYDKILDYIARGKREGATLLCGGGRPVDVGPKGYFIEPVVFADVTEDMSIWKDEIFGPVLCVKTFKTEEEALRLANGTEYGLAGAVFTQDKARLERVVMELDAGICWENAAQPTFLELPWVGHKHSGVGVGLGRWGFETYLKLKQVVGYVAKDPFVYKY